MSMNLGVANPWVTVIICNEDDESVPESAKVIRVPRTVDCLQGLINVIPLQLLSYRAYTPNPCHHGVRSSDSM